MEFRTVILRFRDLVTESGETIDTHNSIIKEKNSVWWAWWNKDSEKVSVDEFSTLRTYAENGPLNVYLLDSGQRKLYKAACNTVSFELEGSKLSPNQELTPEYYRTRNYPAWFQFSCIEECEEEELRGFSYVQVDELFCDNSTNYAMFTGKKVCGLGELIQQNRTIWFVREYKETDPTHEIVLLNARIIEPLDFSTHHFEVDGNAILWLSDLHFDQNVRFLVNNHKEVDRYTLTEHIKESCVDFSDICGLLISGDIVNCGKGEGFTIACDFIKDLNEGLGQKLSSETIVFCPGNHDFIRKDTKLGERSPELLANHPESSENYRSFYHNVHSKTPNEYFACGRKFLMASGRTVEIAALNSITLQQHKDFEGHGFLSQQQLDFVAKSMRWKENENTNAVRIAVMHHHYLPTCFVEKIEPTKASSVVYDAERLMRWLERYNVRILLHGHKHRSFSAVVGFPTQLSSTNVDFENIKQTYVIGMGGTGAADCENIYAVIRFLAESIKIDFYKIYTGMSKNGELIRSININL